MVQWLAVLPDTFGTWVPPETPLKNKYILEVSDYFSKWMEAYAGDLCFKENSCFTLGAPQKGTDQDVSVKSHHKSRRTNRMGKFNGVCGQKEQKQRTENMHGSGRLKSKHKT